MCNQSAHDEWARLPHSSTFLRLGFSLFLRSMPPVAAFINTNNDDVWGFFVHQRMILARSFRRGSIIASLFRLVQLELAAADANVLGLFDALYVQCWAVGRIRVAKKKKKIDQFSEPWRQFSQLGLCFFDLLGFIFRPGYVYCSLQ